MAFTCLPNCLVQLPEQVIQVLSLNPGSKPESSGQWFGTLPDTAMAAIPIFGKNITLVLLVKRADSTFVFTLVDISLIR